MQGDGETLAADFDEFMANVVLIGAPPKVRGDMKIAYYSGAVAMYNRMLRAGERGTDAETRAAFNAIETELEEYLAWLDRLRDNPEKRWKEN